MHKKGFRIKDCPFCPYILSSFIDLLNICLAIFIIPLLTCNSSTFLLPYWAERLGEWRAWHWPKSDPCLCFHAGVWPQGWMLGETDILAHTRHNTNTLMPQSSQGILYLVVDFRLTSSLLCLCTITLKSVVIEVVTTAWKGGHALSHPTAWLI